MENQKIILCVDDERLVLVSLKAQLKKNLGDAYRIEMAENGEDGLAIVEEIMGEGHDLPLVISDQIMPGMKGDDFLIRLHGLLPATRSIMLTGQANADAVGNALNRARLYRYISKPWDETDLMMAVNAALDSHYKEQTIERQQHELERLVNQLHDHNESLERTVSERTAQVNLQNEELKKREAMLAEVNTAKDKLFAVIAHDMKNSMSALLSIADSLNRSYGELEETDKVTGIQRISQASKEMNQLLEHLLDWVKIQCGRTGYSPEVFDLFQVADEMIALSRSALEKKQVLIVQSTDCRARVMADRNMIGTVMRNLLNNAIKFSPRGSEIRVQCNAVKSENGKEYHEVMVEDQGIGMHPDRVANLFRPARNETVRGTENEKGTGLGLIICRDFLQINGGQLKVESEPGRGSRFSFALPACNGDCT
jgi:two-component system, sensor histidine kinase and response regulator